MEDIDRLFAAGQRGCPGLSVERSAFEAVVRDARERGECELNDASAFELYLACACACQVPGAFRRFEQQYVAPLDQTLARLVRGRAELDEVKQRLRIRLLVAEDGRRPRIVEYAGRGRLGGLVQVVATRIALNLRRRTPSTPRADALVQALDDPELSRLRADELAVFKASFEAAIALGTPRERTLLRLHLLDGLSIDEIAPIYDVHRSTAARWLAAARSGVTERTRSGLQTRLGPDSTSMRALLHVLHSRLDLSLSRVLRDHAIQSPSSHDGSTSRH